MSGVKGRSGRPRRQTEEVRKNNILLADQVISRFLRDETIKDVEKIELASKLVIKDMGVKETQEQTKMLTQNNFFTQIINKAASEVRTISRTPHAKIYEVEAQKIREKIPMPDLQPRAC